VAFQSNKHLLVTVFVEGLQIFIIVPLGQCIIINGLQRRPLIKWVSVKASDSTVFSEGPQNKRACTDISVLKASEKTGFNEHYLLFNVNS